MPVHNAEIAAVFSEMADLLEIEGENPFRIRAYRSAARTLEDSGQQLARMLADGKDLTEIPGIGKDLAAKIAEIVATGSLKALLDLRTRLPPGVSDFLRLPGIGPKKVKALLDGLKIQTLADLEQAAREQRIRAIAGFGEKTEKQILESIAKRTDTTRRFLRAHVEPYAEALADYLRAIPQADTVTLAGSYRRLRETVGDLDILVVSGEAKPVMDAFVAYDEVAEVLAHGPAKSSVRLRSGLQVDVRVVERTSYGAALHYFTGSKSHNIEVRRLGQQRGLKVNEYGVFRDEKQIAGATEDEVFRSVDLPCIPPELREMRGEIEAAGKGTLPALIKEQDIRGDLHAHTTASDGKNSIREMAEAAIARGYEYFAVTDHSKRLTVAGGLDENRLLRQLDEIDKINAGLKGFTVLKGIEVDILDDGGLDLSDEVLARLDVVVGSVHSRFKLSREKQTARVLKAMDHPHFSILGHPTGRLLLERDPFDIDVEQVIRHAAQRGCFVELNANPLRLDLHDVHCQMARDLNVLVSIDTDAHGTGEFANLRHGIAQARRGWLEKKDVLNTRGLKDLKTLLAAARR